MIACILCRKYNCEKAISDNDTINEIEIKNILYDLNYKFPNDAYINNNTICAECYCNLEELYNFRDSCCGLFQLDESTNNRCKICYSEFQILRKLSNFVDVNDSLIAASEILNEICSYEIDIKSTDNVCTKCYSTLINSYYFHLECVNSLNFWTTHYLTENSTLHISRISTTRGEIGTKKEMDTTTHCFPKSEIHYDCELSSLEKKSFINNSYHIKKHRKKQYNCKICIQPFLRKIDLTEHYKLHPIERPYKCKMCSKSFTQLGNLKIHCKIHTDEKPFKCNICSKSFRQFGNLQTHFRTHTKEKPFKCKTCSKSFTQIANLNAHLRTHTNEKPYQCKVCSKTFAQLSNLQVHFRIHNNEKPYKCDTCSKAFRQMTSLNNHMNGKSFKCKN